MPNGELVHRFKHHRPDAVKSTRHEVVRIDLYAAAAMIERTVPAGREQSLALTKIEEAMFWANAGIAREAAKE